MVSQSIFLVNVTVYDTNGSPANGTWEPEETYYTSITDCGYSNMAIILAIILAGITVIFLLGNSLRRLQPGIPVAGGCSAVISAACHVLDDRDVSILGSQVGCCERRSRGSTRTLLYYKPRRCCKPNTRSFLCRNFSN